jgi:hypothetical protein
MTFNPIDLTDFPAHLKSLTLDDWQPLFGLIYATTGFAAAYSWSFLRVDWL